MKQYPNFVKELQPILQNIEIKWLQPTVNLTPNPSLNIVLIIFINTPKRLNKV